VNFWRLLGLGLDLDLGLDTEHSFVARLRRA
jgi:hypothetical protein